MKKAVKVWVAILVVAMLFVFQGCSSSDAQSGGDDQQQSGDIELKYAENFNITYLDDGMKIVTDSQDRQVLLLHEDQKAPEEYADLSVVTIPISNVIYTNSVDVGFLRAFEDDALYDSIVGVRRAADEWDFESMSSRMLDGSIVDIGSNTSMTVTYDYEIMQSINPEFVVLGGMGIDEGKLETMLDGIEVPYVFAESSSENDYRGTMEWVKFIAAFYDLDEEAEEYFDAAMERIDEVIATVENEEKPKVGWAIVAMGQVYVEDAGSKTAQMLRDAGAEYLFDGIGDETNSVTSISVEEFYERLAGADLLIYRGMPKYSPDKQSVIEQAPALGDLVIFQEDKVWQISDNFWDSYHTIDQKYVELAAILHPDLFPDVELSNFVLMPGVAE